MNTIKNNFVATADDYHEFLDIKKHLQLAGLSYSCQEIEYGQSRFGNGYHAVFWLMGTDKPVEFIEELNKEIQNKFK